jgi:CBS domain-containing protein
MDTTVLASGAAPAADQFRDDRVADQLRDDRNADRVSDARNADRVSDARVAERAEFLARHEPFTGFDRPELERVAAALRERAVAAGDVVLVESGPPGTELYMVREGTFELTHKQALVAILTSGEVFGHPTLLTGLPPELSTRARQDSMLYVIPKEVALDVLSRPEGLRFVAGNLRERLLDAARTMRALPDVVNRPVTSLLRSAPLFCDPDTTAHEAAGLMEAEKRSALLVRTRDGLGIVTDRDLRDKVLAHGLSPETPVSAVMTQPVRTVSADALAPEAAIEMMAAGVDFLPVVDAGGDVVGLLSAGNLMTLDARSPFALRRTIHAARTLDDVVKAAADVPQLFVDLMASHLDAPAVARVLTLLHDATTQRVLELAVEARGEPPVAYAWLAFGSAARSELNLVSDQDNGLAFDDADDPSVEEYFRLLAEDVNQGLQRCSYALDVHGTVAANWQWRLPLAKWCAVFSRALEGNDLDRLARASVAFDFRQIAGDLPVALALTEIIREAPRHGPFMSGLAALGTKNPSALTLLQRLPAHIDIKKEALRPLQNLARYHAVARGITAHTTLERLVAVREAGGLTADSEQLLREAFLSMLHLQLRHHAHALRAGRQPDNIIDTTTLRPLTRVALHEALRERAAAPKRFARAAGDR